ncbi:MAG: hypothetical protein N4A61_02380 [Pelagimonas sp.]|jgi:hypothetical protein|nr:hypothetical protein [Pelagimonas sp.]
MKQLLETIQDVELADSSIHGTGVFTTRPRQRGEILTILDGQVLRDVDDLDFLLAHEWNAISDTEILLRPIWTTYGFINHARPAFVTYNLFRQTLEMKKDAPAGTELTLDYLEHGIPAVYLASHHAAYLR